MRLKNCNALNRMNYSILIYLFLFFLTSCYASQNSISTSQRFTPDNIMKIYGGMTSGEVSSIFGNPLRTESQTFGGRTGDAWQGLIWYYDNKQISTRKFIFGKPGDQLILQYWDVK